MKKSTKRIPLSNKIRFEVFKRDNFKCQYCGMSAPEIVLNCDHINPVAKGGTNDMFNLITSCFKCNNGKKARKLSDENEITKQKKQLELLSERRTQLDMLFKWRNGILNIETNEAEKLTEYLFNKIGGDYLHNNSDIVKMKSYLKKLSSSDLIKIIDESIDSIADKTAYWGVTEKTFEILYSIIHAKYMSNTATHKGKIAYIIKKLNYDFGGLEENTSNILKAELDEYFSNFPSVQDYIEIQNLAKETENIQSFYNYLNTRINGK